MQTDSGMIALFIVGGAFLLFTLIIALMYNSLVRLRNLIKESWSDVDTELKRRHDLIPNLVSAVRGYMKYESSVLERITQLRSMAQTSKPGEELAKMENEITGGLRQIFAVVEKYPELKSSTQVADLQRELVRTEDRIQAARRFFNGNVRD
ncbi:MAG: LemA family protein, partial [Candidatus Brocadiia bacterium]